MLDYADTSSIANGQVHWSLQHMEHLNCRKAALAAVLIIEQSYRAASICELANACRWMAQQMLTWHQSV